MSEKVRIQDDLYQAVNGEWIEKAVIPADRPRIGGFSDLDEGVEKLLIKDFEAFAKGEKTTDAECMGDAIRLFQKVLDTKRRDAEGIEPALPLLEKIRSIKSVNELNEKAYEFALDGIVLPFECGVTDDMADATKHSFVLVGPEMILPDVPYYQNPQGQQMLQLYAMMAGQALAKTPLSPEEQKQYLDDTLAYDALISKRVKSQVEWANYVNNHNPLLIDEAQEYMKPFDLKGVLAKIYGENAPKTVIAYDLRAIKEFSLMFNEETFPLYLHWAYVKTLLSVSSSLSTELYEIGTIYRRALMGIQENPTLDKQAFRVASRVFSEPIGLYYGRTYFGEEAKKDIISMVKKIIATYQERMKTNSFLEESTRKKAIEKLSTIKIKMGYPDAVDPFYLTLKVDEKDSYFAAMRKISRLQILHNLEKLGKPVDRGEWGMPGHMVNACYNPSHNDITFPAAILQAPFYSLKQSPSENLGGIGAVIGHEISHAFDNNGAHFDENGNLADWWSEKDYKSFQELTNRMIEQWDGIEYHGGKVNGTLVVSENIADNGGVAVTLDIMHRLEKPDFQAYFKNWARVWCSKSKEEYIQLLLANDVHSPAELRANIQPRNFSEWYEAFDVKDTDKMYIAPEKRIIIW